MSGEDEETKEPQATSPKGDESHTPQPKLGRRSFENVQRELKENEFNSPVVQKMLLDDLDRLETVETEFKHILKAYYEARIELAVASEKLRTHNGFDILSTSCIAIGSIISGAAFSFEIREPIFMLLEVLGVVLIAVGIFSKWIRA